MAPLMSPIDAGFLWAESASTLMHFGGLYRFSRPAGAGADFLGEQVAEARRHTTPAPPFNRRVIGGRLGALLPRWDEVDHVDTSYHVQQHTLAFPGGERELLDLVAQLHAVPLDRAHPLWQVHMIDGLPDGRFAIYAKLHHSVTDGVGAMRIAARAMTEDPAERGLAPMWAQQPKRRSATRRDGLSPVAAVSGAVRAAATLAALYRPAQISSALVRPFAAPRAVLNGSITSARQVATLRLPLDEVKRIAADAGATVNDVVLAVTAGGLRQYLGDLGRLPKRPLTVGMPISYRPSGDEESGNALTFGIVSLATHLADPRQRFDAIVSSAAAAKAHTSTLRQGPAAAYTLLLMAPVIGTLATGLGTRIRPIFNLIVSNVRGPARPLYYNGAALRQINPVSIAMDGQALNVTVLSYADALQVSFTAGGAALPDLDKLAAHANDALSELATAVRR